MQSGKGTKTIRIISLIKSGFSIFDHHITADFLEGRTEPSTAREAIAFVKLDFLRSFIEHIE